MPIGPLPDLFQKLQAAHARRIDIGQRDPGIAREVPQRLAARTSESELQLPAGDLLAQTLGKERPCISFVIDQQIFVMVCQFLARRQSYGECGIFLFFSIHSDAAAMRFDDIIAQAQS